MNRSWAMLSSVVAVVVSLSIGMISAGDANAAYIQQPRFGDFHADYYLSKDDEGRSTLRVVETIEVTFPDFDQNKGITRWIPNTYDGHSVSIGITSITRNGQPEPIYGQEVLRGHIVLETGNESYVKGRQVYVITYTMRDVTKDLGSHQEFYWEVNGTDWEFSFTNVSASVYLDNIISSDFNNRVYCYEGDKDSNAPCGSATTEANVIKFSTGSSVSSGYGLTVVVGFNAGSFAAYNEGLIGVARPYVIGSVFVMTVVIIAGAFALRRKSGGDAKGRGTIVPEYLAPRDPIRFSASLAKVEHKFMAAQIVALAVNRNVNIIETEKAGLFGKKRKTYSIELVSTEGLNQDELKIVGILFAGYQAGSRYEFKTSAGTTEMRLQQYISLGAHEMIQQGYRRKANVKFTILHAILVLLWIASIILSFFVLPHNDGSASYPLFMLTILLTVATTVVSVLTLLTYKPLTEKGVTLRDYMKGLDMYIKLAEAERFRFLHSVIGAGRVRVDTNDKEQMVKMYEKLLPYAILFGHEKSWSKELEIYYAETSTVPSWYVGSSTLGFMSSVSSLSTAISSISQSVNSSSSGLGGGGSVGGGGGGGGGGVR